jgi:hypothetical protein
MVGFIIHISLLQAPKHQSCGSTSHERRRMFCREQAAPPLKEAQAGVVMVGNRSARVVRHAWRFLSHVCM